MVLGAHIIVKVEPFSVIELSSVIHQLLQKQKSLNSDQKIL